ncbi:hypothetical protein J6590_050791 [Homalodisca vitripennis]|nr:hypothetical protein J6590_050791 [Homalodisca vitripennis]
MTRGHVLSVGRRVSEDLLDILTFFWQLVKDIQRELDTDQIEHSILIATPLTVLSNGKIKKLTLRRHRASLLHSRTGCYDKATTNDSATDHQGGARGCVNFPMTGKMRRRCAKSVTDTDLLEYLRKYRALFIFSGTCNLGNLSVY